VHDVGIKKPTLHVYLDPAVRPETEGKMEVFTAVYQNLTGKKVVFDYLIYQRNSELIMQRECRVLRVCLGMPCSTLARPAALVSFSLYPRAPRARPLSACTPAFPCLCICATCPLQACKCGHDVEEEEEEEEERSETEDFK